MTLKVCTDCKLPKPIEEFHKDYRRTGARSARKGMGVQAQCKACRAERRKPGIVAERARAEDLRARNLKRCSVCGEVKLRDEFNVHSTTSDGLSYRCIECGKAYLKTWREKNPDAFREWYSENKEARAQYWKEWYSANRERRAENYKIWASKNKHIVNALIAKRSAVKKRALAKWADLRAIRAIYEEAAWLTFVTGVRHEVDHIYPLQGKTMCGLHCEANLQILTKTQNLQKGNRTPEDVSVNSSGIYR